MTGIPDAYASEIYCQDIEGSIGGTLEVLFADVCVAAILELVPIELVQWLYVL